MSSIDRIRRTKLAVSLNNVDISADINDNLISAEYTDVEDGSADDIQIVIADRDNEITGGWLSAEVDKRGQQKQESAENCPYDEPSGELKKGSSGNGVKWLQWHLNKVNNAKLSVDGDFGNQTKSAVTAYQKKIGVKQTGKVNASLRSRMKTDLQNPTSDKCPYAEPTNKLKKGSSGNGVKWLQWHLNKVNNAKLSVDGDFGNQTKSAVKAYQKKVGMTQSGECDAAMRKKLEDELTASIKKPKTAQKTARLTVQITQENTDGDGRNKVLRCGTFELDEVEMDGPPQKVTIRGTALAYSSALRKNKHSRAWENTTLQAIANAIAAASGYAVVYLTNKVVKYTRKQQDNVSYIVFLQKLCTQAGLSLKITGNKIIIYDQKEYESKVEVRKIKRGDGTYSSYSFKTSLTDTAYTSCHVLWTNSNGNKIEYTFTPPGFQKDEDNVLEIDDEPVETVAEAKELAIARLREANKGETTGSFSMPGDVTLSAGQTISVSGFADFDGKYIIEESRHSVGKSGYKTSIEIRKAITEY